MLQVGFRWAGEANIALAIEPIVSLGSVLRMVPKVSNLRVRQCQKTESCAVKSRLWHEIIIADVLERLSLSMRGVQMSGVWRIVMKPLIDDVPVVAGMVVAMKAPPQVRVCLHQPPVDVHLAFSHGTLPRCVHCDWACASHHSFLLSVPRPDTTLHNVLCHELGQSGRSHPSKTQLRDILNTSRRCRGRKVCCVVDEQLPTGCTGAWTWLMPHVTCWHTTTIAADPTLQHATHHDEIQCACRSISHWRWASKWVAHWW